MQRDVPPFQVEKSALEDEIVTRGHVFPVFADDRDALHFGFAAVFRHCLRNDLAFQDRILIDKLGGGGEFFAVDVTIFRDEDLRSARKDGIGKDLAVRLSAESGAGDGAYFIISRHDRLFVRPALLSGSAVLRFRLAEERFCLKSDGRAVFSGERAALRIDGPRDAEHGKEQRQQKNDADQDEQTEPPDFFEELHASRKLFFVVLIEHSVLRQVTRSVPKMSSMA